MFSANRPLSFFSKRKVFGGNGGGETLLIISAIYALKLLYRLKGS